MRPTFPFLFLFLSLIVQGCATSPYRTATPYPEKPVPRPAVKQHDYQPGTTKPAEPSSRQPVNPIINDISQQTHQLIQNGQLEAAAQTLERGLRIAPKEASFWSQLAAVRLQQHRYGQALSLAAKSNSLAGGNRALIRRNQLIIEEAQRAQK